MLARLNDRGLDLLDDGADDTLEHHRTLRNAIHRSYALMQKNPFEMATALKRLAHVAFLEGDLAGARAQAGEALQILRDLGEPWAIAQSLLWLGRITWRQRDKERALSGAAKLRKVMERTAMLNGLGVLK